MSNITRITPPRQAIIDPWTDRSMDLFHDADQHAYATVNIWGARHTLALDSPLFSLWLRQQMRQAQPDKPSPSEDTVRRRVRDLVSVACLDRPERPVYLRVAPGDDRITLHLARPDGRVVDVTPDGWTVIDLPREPAFAHRPSLRPLPLPVAGGRIDALRQFLNVASDDDYSLIIAWLLYALRGRGPYPVLVLSGPQGTGKSTIARALKTLIDPSQAPLIGLSATPEDLFVSAVNRHILAIDNVSALSGWMADRLCQLSTGGGYSRRKQYTNLEESASDCCRPIILNGIPDLLARPDLADRSILVTLSPLDEHRRQTEFAFWDAFHRQRPAILGALLDRAVVGLGAMHHTPPTPSRLAEFGQWAESCGCALPGRVGQTLAANRQAVVESTIEDDTVYQAVSALLRDGREWTGTSTELLAELTDRAHEHISRDRSWPRNPRALSARLRRLAPFMAQSGIDFLGKKRKIAGQVRRYLTLTRTP